MSYVTPRDVARMTGIPATAIREFLRNRYPNHPFKSAWRLDAGMVLETWQHFA
jgi:hypothetical protein